ncbi:hypothetical protein [Actinomyces sp.]|uniref:hypothetical protein n=1 Tax=Actinomyces sp. TaxID=29317 RepID=UPI0026DAD119|nr:hypothetical protein [Actinomyces sp.]MDO4900852.1 hypothetical protein [Actinomyces sp.]
MTARRRLHQFLGGKACALRGKHSPIWAEVRSIDYGADTERITWRGWWCHICSQALPPLAVTDQDKAS